MWMVVVRQPDFPRSFPLHWQVNKSDVNHGQALVRPDITRRAVRAVVAIEIIASASRMEIRY